LIGPKGPGTTTKFQNMKEWIQFKIIEDSKMLDTVEKYVSDSMMDKIMKAKNIPLRKIEEL
jgi:hypothetical protein